MKKSSKLQAKRKPASAAKPKSFTWSIEKAAELRKPNTLPGAGDCSCGGK